MRRSSLLLAVVALLCCTFSVWGQDTANITGTVTDQSGAVIPGAKVTVSNPEKAFVRQLVTNASGEFSAPAIPIGNYEVTAEAAGFQKLTRTGIKLNVGQIQRVDMKMTVGQIAEQVTIEGDVPTVQTETAAISEVVGTRQIANLGLDGRNWVTLATLVPGAVPDNGLDTSHVGVYGNNSISFNGSRTQYNNWEVDGGPNTDEGSAGTFNTYPSIDTIAEFRISTSNYGADMGHHGGATIELATKSGTKDFHGTASEYVRNNVFDAQDFFLNRAGSNQTRPLKWNDYGYTIGGPVTIPKVYNTGRDKTFFFWSENWRKYREGQIISSGVPTLAMRNGDFTECDPGSPNYNSVVASGCTLPSLNGQTFNNVKDMPGYNAQAFANGKALLDSMVPLPNNGPDGWLLASGTNTNWRQEQIRVDQRIGDKMNVFFRYTQDAWNTLAVPTLWAWANFDTIKTPFNGPGKSMVAHVTNTFKPNLVNEFVAGYTLDHIDLAPQVGASSVAGSIDRSATGFVANHLFPANASNSLMPAYGVCGGTPFCYYEDANPYPWHNSNPIFNWKDNLIWTTGKHTVKTGFFLERYRKNEQFGSDVQGAFWFGGGGALTTGNGLADSFLGRIQQYSEGSQVVNGVAVGGYPKGHWRMTDFEPYIQDDWKVTPHLTLNLGMRFFYFTRIHDVSNPTIDSGFIPSQYDPAKEAQLDSNGNIIQDSGHWFINYGNGLVECGKGGVPNGCQKNNTLHNFAPRFGFSWDPIGNGNTVIRGGWGYYFESGNGNEAQTEGGEGNPPAAFNVSGYDILGYSNIVPGALGPTGFTMIPFSQKWPTYQQYSLSIQHEFGSDNLLSVAYVGNQGRHLARAHQQNLIPYNAGIMNVPELAGTDFCDAQGNCDVQQSLINEAHPSIFFVPFRGYNSLNMKENNSSSTYNSMQLSFRHNFSHGLTFQSAYTWSKLIDDSTSTYNGSWIGDDHNIARFRAQSDLNRTQVLVMNFVYDLPFFNKSSHRAIKGVLGGWQFSGIGTFFTGQPINIGCGVDGYQTGIGTSVSCNTTGKLVPKKGTFNDPTFGPTTTWFDPGVLQQPLLSQYYANGEPGMFGYLGRNVLVGPGRNNWDMALLKNFKFTERLNVQFRWETFNTFNHTQWKGVNAGCSGSTPFGGSCADSNNLGNGEVNSTWPARIMQGGLKIIF